MARGMIGFGAVHGLHGSLWRQRSELMVGVTFSSAFLFVAIVDKNQTIRQFQCPLEE